MSSILSSYSSPSSSPTPPPSAAKTTRSEATATSFSDIHHDILQSHILTRLDGPALASTSCVSSHLRVLSSDERLWADVSRSSWPSIDVPNVSRVISTFPGGHRSFFADAYPLLADDAGPPSTVYPRPPEIRRHPSELISAVDICYHGHLIFSRTAETETESGWFRCSPFRIDMLEPKDVVPTPVPFPSRDNTTCGDLGDGLRLSWVLINPEGQRAMNLSSIAPVSIQRHWLSGEVHAQFTTIVCGGERGTAAEQVACTIAITCGGSRGGTMQVREVCVQMEDMEGKHLNGGESLAVLQRAMEGKRGTKMREEEEGRRRYEDFLERRRERRERRARAEGALDAVCVSLGSAALVVFWLFVLCR